MTTKPLQITAESKLADILKINLNLLFVLNQFGIPLGFGERSIKEVCLKQEVHLEAFLALLQFHHQPEKADFDQLSELSTQDIIGYLKASHGYFLEFRLPNICSQLKLALPDSGARNTILSYFEEYETEVREHMHYENEVFFPYVEQLVNGLISKEYSVNEFESRHNDIEEKLNDLINLLLKYIPVQGNMYRLSDVLEELQLCNRELDRHRLLEDEVLVPKIRRIEKLPEHKTDKHADAEELSDREKDIVCAVAKGLSNKEIAEKLFISIHTVITHRKNISKKLSIHSPAGLTVYAILHKLVDIEDLRL